MSRSRIGSLAGDHEDVESYNQESNSSISSSSNNIPLARKHKLSQQASSKIDLANLKLEEVQEVGAPESTDAASSRTDRLRGASSSVSPLDSRSRLDDPVETIVAGEVMEWEKKGPGSVWHKTEYVLARNGLVYRTRQNSGRDLVPFDLRYMDVDRAPVSTDPSMPPSEQAFSSIRLMKYDHDGSEHIWYMKHDDPDTLSEWYTELKGWKDDWHYHDWKQNLFVQIPRVPVNLDREFNLAKTVASERELGGKGQGGDNIVYDQELGGFEPEIPLETPTSQNRTPV